MSRFASCFLQSQPTAVQVKHYDGYYGGQGRMAQDLTADKYVELYTLQFHEYRHPVKTYRFVFVARSVRC